METEKFYEDKISLLENSSKIESDKYFVKLTSNIKQHGMLNRNINELDLLIRSCPDEDNERKKQLKQISLKKQKPKSLLMQLQKINGQ